MKDTWFSAVCGFTGALLLSGLAPLAAAADAPLPVAVKVAHPAHGDVFRFVSLPATVHANRQATLYAKVAGYLKTISVDKGDTVKAGSSLALIESPELLADLASDQAGVRVAQADYQRLSSAQKKAPDLIVPMQVDESKGRLDTAEARLQRTQTLLGYSKVVAPFNGIITMRYVDPGAFIPAATSSSGAQAAGIVTLMDFDTVRVSVPVPEIEAPLVNEGQPAKVSADSLPGKVFEGKVSRHAYALDDATKTMLVEVDIPNPAHELRPGMYVTVKLGVEKHVDTLLIPSAALVMEKANAFTYLADGSKAKKKAIKIGFNDGTKVEVLDGLHGDETVIFGGGAALADGADINVADAK